jgi:hypothetical protein
MNQQLAFEWPIPKAGRREYISYQCAKQRCRNPRRPGYAYYGGRGIRFLFTSFEQFFAELGPRPPGTTLHRKDVDGNYEPGNVRWATTLEQNRSKRRLTHCPHGHEYTPENIHIGKKGERYCRACLRERKRAERRRNRLKLNESVLSVPVSSTRVECASR